jgi:hypothetical protein
MAVTENTYTGNGSTDTYSFTFPYLDAADIKVSLNGTPTTAYTLATATTIQFNTAPANGVAIRIYRVTDDAALNATFISGSAIRAVDLNDNFTQNLYVTQESNRDATSAIATANSALSASATAVSTANTALSQSATAVSDSATALSQSNTAISDSATALSQSNTAISNSATAVSTANSAASDAATALSQSNTALADSATALSQSNTAIADSATAVSDSATALSQSNTAISDSATALSTANSADTKADSAIAAVANALLFTIVANVAAIPGSPTDGDAVEVTDSTGIESFTPLSGVPSGFTGDSGLSVRIIYDGGNTTWDWLQYFPNDPETRYGDAITTLQSDVLGLDNNKLSLTGGTLTGALTLHADPTTDLQAATKQYVDNSPGGATGGGSDQVFYENDQTVTTNYTITTNRNAVTAGPVTVNSGVTVTIPDGSNWVVV